MEEMEKPNEDVRIATTNIEQKRKLLRDKPTEVTHPTHLVQEKTVHNPNYGTRQTKKIQPGKCLTEIRMQRD